MAKKRAAGKKTDQAANLGFETRLWLTADKLRNNMDAPVYKHVVLGLMFLKYISDAFDETRRLNSFSSLAITPTNDCFRAGSQEWIDDFPLALCN